MGGFVWGSRRLPLGILTVIFVAECLNLHSSASVSWIVKLKRGTKTVACTEREVIAFNRLYLVTDEGKSQLGRQT